MDAFAVPGDVLAVMGAAGLRPVAALAPSAWLATAGVEGERGTLVELHVVPVPFDERLAARASVLAGLDDEHLPRVRTVAPLGPGRCALVVEHVAGTSLARLRAARSPLSDGEAVTVVVPIAGALAALHRAGLAHGAVRADAVVVEADGRPVLTDLRGALLGTGTDDDDLRRLLATVLDLVPSADVELLAAPTDAATMRRALETLLGSPEISADAIVDRSFAVAAPEPVRLPDAGALVWAEVAEPAHRGAHDRGGAEGAGAASRSDAPAAPGGSRRARRSEGRAPRGRGAAATRRDRGWRRLALTTATVVAVCMAGTAVVAARHSAADAAGPRPVASSLAPEPDPVAAAVRLTQRRADALAALDATALVDVDASGSPALAADEALVRKLGAARLDGLRVDVVASPSAQPAGTAAAVVVTSTTSAYVRVAADGSRTTVGASAPRTVVLDLRRTADGWRVWDVRAAG
jgi:hypothetical protein